MTLKVQTTAQRRNLMRLIILGPR
ncbi:hypothetical protein Gotri_015585 [Gossypium trilobum]|uniref:Uncharacterized protein n=2 Tax=Gossypium TaxID=3633 RepID=A0A7J9E1A8_9ROSI|nr:hypothetical protein [Gossypium aridum]MBA0766554.1 hypothetical protein [Gossypium trilobum]